MAEGSLEECRYYRMLAQDLKYGDAALLAASLDEVGRLLHAYAAAVLTPAFNESSSSSDSCNPSADTALA